MANAIPVGSKKNVDPSVTPEDVKHFEVSVEVENKYKEPTKISENQTRQDH